MKRTVSLLLLLAMVISLLSFQISADNTIQHQYSTSANSGIRHEVCTTLNGTSAANYYTGNYTYNKLSQLDRSTLLTTLRTLMTSTHKYKSSYNDCRDLAVKTDCQNGDGVTVTLLYNSYKTDWNHWTNNYSGGWNREHVWPQSLGGFKTSGPGSDMHHVRPSDAGINGDRGNKKYGNVSGGSPSYGASYTDNGLGGYYNSNYFEPLDEVKGDVARIILYMYVRYGGENSQCNSVTNVFQSVDVLLEWCAIDPVDTWEMGRNEVVGAKQGNRNVFIDYPELAWQLFGKEAPAGMTTPSSGSSSSTNPPATEPPATEPPATEPPATEPPATEPPCTHSSTVVRNAVAATCLSEGYTGDTYCAKCGDLISYGKKIPVVAQHQFGEWQVELEPTETEDGHKIRTCSICRHTETETLPATGVKETDPAPTDPENPDPDTTQPGTTDPVEDPSVPTIPTFTSPPKDTGVNGADQNSITFWIIAAVLWTAGILIVIFVPKKKAK